MRALWLLLLFSGTALADEAGLARCRAIPEAGARLACYDALPLAPASPASAGRAPAPVFQKQTPEQFGMEREASAHELAQIESHIPGNFECWGPNTSITLANGQVWRITDNSARMCDLRNPKVTIRRGVLGSFFLEIEGEKRAPKVRRIH